MSTVIKVENLSKQYRLGDVGTGTLSHDLKRWWYKARGKEDPYLQIGEANDRATKGESDYVWALKNINFEVKAGEVLGIIGRNGAGKSTLLKILSKTTTPTTGSVKVYGRIASLLEVGTGFHPELTGRENIYLNGAILGMTKREIQSKFDEIVDFSGVERYIDTPVKRYSSGMYVRLAFAVAAHLEPEILIVDEVLAVGDAEFQKKCLGKMKDVSVNEGRTVLFVSHNLVAMETLCTKTVYIENGMIKSTGDTRKLVKQYYDSNNAKINISTDLKKKQRIERCSASGRYPGFLLFDAIEILNERNMLTTYFFSGEKIFIRLSFFKEKPIDDILFHFRLYDALSLNSIALCIIDLSDCEFINNFCCIKVCINDYSIIPGNYIPYFALFSKSDEPYDIIDRVFFDMPLLEFRSDEDSSSTIIKMIGKIVLNG